jgi:hypothetical protein
MSEIKKWSIKQVINGVVYFEFTFETTKKHYDKLVSLLYFPQKFNIMEYDTLYYLNGYFKIKNIDKNSDYYNEYCEFSKYFRIVTYLPSSEFIKRIKGFVFDKKVVVGFRGVGGIIDKLPNIIVQGKEFEYHVSNIFKKQGYKVINNFEKSQNDEGIDIIAIKNDELLLIQCKNWEKSVISHIDIKEFLGNCYLFLYKHKEYRKFKKVRRVYVVSNSNFDSSAKHLLNDYYPFVEYKHIPFKKEKL